MDNIIIDHEKCIIDHERRINLLERNIDKLIGIVESLTSTQGEIVNKVTEESDEDIDDGMTDAEADSDTLASAGYGTDEDYGGTDERL